jgi:hypothetical protein
VDPEGYLRFRELDVRAPQILFAPVVDVGAQDVRAIGVSFALG